MNFFEEAAKKFNQFPFFLNLKTNRKENLLSTGNFALWNFRLHVLNLLRVEFTVPRFSWYFNHTKFTLMSNVENTKQEYHWRGSVKRVSVVCTDKDGGLIVYTNCFSLINSYKYTRKFHRNLILPSRDIPQNPSANQIAAASIKYAWLSLIKLEQKISFIKIGLSNQIRQISKRRSKHSVSSKFEH